MIETRYFQYFLAIAREQNITRAAESLHVSQPTLSKQMKDLEEQLGCQLFIRGKKKIELTEDGMFFRARAQEMLDLMEKTENAFHESSGEISGDVYFGAGETAGISQVIAIYKDILKRNAGVRLHIFSGDADSVMEQIDKGLLDVGLLLAPRKLDKYEYTQMDYSDHFGILMRKDDPLAEKQTVSIEEVYKLPILMSRQTWAGNHPINWNGLDYQKLNIISTHNLIYNASFQVEQGIGYALTLGGLIPESDERNLTFRPISPAIEMELYIVTKRYQTFSPAASLFVNRITDELAKRD